MPDVRLRHRIASALVLLLLVCALFLSLAPTASAGQFNTGEIAGIVLDPTGAVLTDATVTARHPASASIVTRSTDGRGRFYLPALRLGEWELTVAASGFAPHTRRVQVELGKVLDLALSLAVSGVTEAVTVELRVPLLQNNTAEISDVIENREVVQLPLNGRAFLGLAQLSDAVVIPPGGTRGEALQQAGPLPNVGGQRSGHNIYLLDGAKVTDELFNNLVVMPSIDSIAEFKIQKSMYPAEFGGKASALINVATRAGYNRYAGTLFEFHRNSAFDAGNYFKPAGQAVPPLNQNQFGGTLGGPVARDRSFFFASFEGQRMRRSLTQTFSVPSLAVRGGDFSGGATICDPATTAATGTCVPFANNRIPADRIDPVAAALLTRVPLPTSGAGVQNLTAVEAQTRQLNQLSLRLDQRLTDQDQLTGRFSTFDADEAQPFGTSVLQERLLPGFGRSLTTHTRNLMVSHTRSIGRRFLNELRVGWMGVRGGQQSDNRGVDFASQVGLLGVTADGRDVGYPQVQTAGLYSPMGDPTVFTTRNNHHVELYENLTVDRGAHRIKAGGYLFHLRLRPEQPDNARGVFNFTGQFSGNAFADFLLGYSASGTSGIGRGDEDGRTTWLHLYAQDDWQARDNLTFNLGLRYEFNQHMFDARNRLSSIDLSVPGGRYVIASDAAGRIDPSAQALLPLLPIPYVTSQAAGWGPGLLDPSAVRLAPRLGAALALNDARTVVRGGYGIFLNQWAYSVQTAFARNLPFFFTKQVDIPAQQTIPTLNVRNMLTTDATGTIAGNIMDYAYSVEYSQTWSGGIQHELAPSFMVEAQYMGTLTLGADNATIHNVPEPGPGSIQARRPIPQLGRINAIRFDGESIYHALTLKADKRLSRRTAFNVSYTLSKSVDDASSPGATEAETNVPQNVRNIFSDSGEWAPSSFDKRHIFVASGVYQIPVASGRGLTGLLLGGWRANAIFIAQSGSPFTVNLAVDRANIGAGPAQRPDQIRDPNLPGGQRTAERWFDTDAFALQAPFTFGSATRNSVVGPGYASLDLALAKLVTLGTRQLELRWEIFNLLNRANFDLPNRQFGNPSFGRIFSAKNPREMQFGLRLSF